MTKSLEHYAKRLTPIPHTIPGLYRWKVSNSDYGYPFLRLQKWEPKRRLFSREEIPGKGTWVQVAAQQMSNTWDEYDIHNKSLAIVNRLRVDYEDTNIVMAERV